MELCPTDASSFETSLTATEKEYLATYRAQDPQQCYQLNQDPHSGMGSTSTPWALQTVIHNCHLLWHDLPDQGRRGIVLRSSKEVCSFPLFPAAFFFSCVSHQTAFQVDERKRGSRHIGPLGRGT